MFTILVADDQREEREGIDFLIHELGLPLRTHMAENGRKAIEFLEHTPVDILLTDVRMPIMDGLQLATQALRLHSGLKVILFSGYAEFEYARTAIKLGVSDYLLKPIHVDTFHTTMQRVIHQLSAQKKETLVSQAKQDYVKKHILFQLVNGLGVTPSLNGAAIGLPSQYHGIMLLEFERNFFENAGPDFEEFILSFMNVPVDYLNLNGCQSLLLFPDLDSCSPATPRELGLLIRNRILETYKTNCYVAINDEWTSLPDLAFALAQLEQLMECRFFSPDHFVYEQRADSFYSEQLLDEMLPDLSDNDLLQHIRTNLKERDFFGVRANTDLLYQKYARKPQFSQLYVKYMFSSLYEDILSCSTPPSEWDLSRGIERIYKSDELLEIKGIITEGITRLEQEYSSSEYLHRDIVAIKQYIEDHYEEDLSLDHLAAKVHLSPHYLSSIFKKYTGCGLNKYIKNVRMIKASEMLDQTHLKVSDICYKVGFQNVSYFCQTFRDFYGLTPERFRQTHQK